MDLPCISYGVCEGLTQNFGGVKFLESVHLQDTGGDGRIR